MHTIWLFLCRLWCWSYITFRGYQGWSYLYRFIWEREYRDRPVMIFNSIAELGRYLAPAAGKYKADSWRQLGDAVSYPQTAQAAFDGVTTPSSGIDCDEFAVFAANSIQRGLAIGVTKGGSEPKFMTITWMRGWKAGGHNVCLVRLDNGDRAYLDYGAPKVLPEDLNLAAKLIAETYCQNQPHEMIGWWVSRPDLTPELSHWGD